MNNVLVLLGAGCFWGVETLLKQTNGIIRTEVGYSGGNTVDPTYPEVCTGTTGHAEVVQVIYDQSIISFEKVLDFFFRLHDPTTLNRQHNDIGTQYRSVIFYSTEDQKTIALDVIQKLNDSKIFKNLVVTQVEKITNFYSAEEYHQDYLKKNPDGYMCHILRK